MRSGIYVENLKDEYKYESFKPMNLPVELFLDKDMEKKIENANELLAFFNGYISNVPNIDLYSYMYIKKEALHSSEIEGTQCTLIDILDIRDDMNTNRDLKDVVSHISALEYSIDRLNILPLSKRFIREMHEKLIANSRGQEKNPGEFRKSQNWIGSANCGIKKAKYIPPNVSDMEEALDNLEQFMNYDDSNNLLVNAALLHYQFETIHPFLDGNGRVGRMLTILYLISKGIINVPLVSLSYYLKENQREYYDRMMLVRKKGEYEQWIDFFIDCIIESTMDSIRAIKKLKELNEKNIEKISKHKKKKEKLLILFEYIEKHPIINIGNTAKDLGMSYNTIGTLIEILCDDGILFNIADMKRNRRFVYMEYINILNGDYE